LSEHSKDIDDIMHHYDSSNDAEKREMFEDLLHAEDDESGGFSEEDDFLGLGLVLFWVIGGFFICNIIYNHFPVINSYFRGEFSETCGAWFLAVVSWTLIASFCVFGGGFVASLIILCLLAFANIVL